MSKVIQIRKNLKRGRDRKEAEEERKERGEDEGKK